MYIYMSYTLTLLIGRKKNFKVNAFRIINHEDIVTRIPAPGFYEHVGQLRYIDANGAIHNQLIKKDRPSNQPGDELYGEDSNEEETSSFSGFVPQSFRDHVPLLYTYTIHIWNSIVSSKTSE